VSRSRIWLAILALGTVPFPFLGSSTRFLAGFPLWLWWSAAFTVALAVATSLTILRGWRDDDDGRH